MRAITYHQYGQPDVLSLVDAPDPVPESDQVLVEVHTAGVNPWDWDRLTGTPVYARLEGLRTPAVEILGAEIAGTVVATGKHVTSFSPGDEVFGDISHDGWGGFAELVAVHPARLARKPPTMSWIDAAALPQAGVLALQGLNWRGSLDEGHRLLINGAGGGVGTLAVQIAKHTGCHVTAVDTGEKLDALTELGADEVIDYRITDFTKTGRRYDVILDVISTRSARAMRRSLAGGGRAAIIGGTPRAIVSALAMGWVHTARSNQEIGVVVHAPNREDTEHLAEKYAQGVLKPVIHEVYALGDVPRALADIGTHAITGKAVIQVS